EVISPNSKVIIPVHFAGQPCDMVAIKAFADKHNLYVIEDACHALGGTYKGAPIGNCTYSDMSVFSLHPAKSIAAGEGGVITTNDKGLYDTLIRLRSHGITKAPDLLTQNPGPWYYEMHDLGYNYRLTDIQSALASSQLSKLDRFVTRRREIKDMYNNAFSDQPYVSPLVELEPNSSAWHLYVLRIDFDKLGKSRKTVMEELVALGIGSQVHYIPVPSQPYYVKNNNSRSGDVPQSMDFYNQALSIPMFPSLTEIEINTVIAAVKSVIA
ncbi:UDP-4-amino-4,6-dideoxy-N-acetyl-beta-L-altrosamine transaminase, partial [bacterium]|nr:UDP-4-amino-4,6-dideoxy-N-acetyl-beta-L-altrosamine transaminase [bacterium]